MEGGPAVRGESGERLGSFRVSRPGCSPSGSRPLLGGAFRGERRIRPRGEGGGLRLPPIGFGRAPREGSAPSPWLLLGVWLEHTWPKAPWQLIILAPGEGAGGWGGGDGHQSRVRRRVPERLGLGKDSGSPDLALRKGKATEQGQSALQVPSLVGETQSATPGEGSRLPGRAGRNHAPPFRRDHARVSALSLSPGVVLLLRPLTSFPDYFSPRSLCPGLNTRAPWGRPTEPGAGLLFCSLPLQFPLLPAPQIGGALAQGLCLVPAGKAAAAAAGGGDVSGSGRPFSRRNEARPIKTGPQSHTELPASA